jgi:tRNA (adenine37-N6)-methyltransferase
LFANYNRSHNGCCLQEEARLLDEERRSERAGRTRAERALRDLQLQLGTVDPTTISPSGNASDASVDLGDVAYPLRPIGVLRSCFMKRNGTPRQPLLVATARASLKMRGELKGSLEGLEGYTHCWILFIFHQNTDLQRLWQSKERQYDGVRSKIRVPRLNGARLGVFATRSPHRPNPIGLSIARIDAIDDKQGVLWLSGVDIVDGSPVLDVKPFVPFCDAVSHAMAPSWVSDVAPGGEPLEIRSVKWSDVGERAVKECWDARRGLSLYDQYDEFRAFVLDALSRDIRSVTQRVKVIAPASVCFCFLFLLSASAFCFLFLECLNCISTCRLF